MTGIVDKKDGSTPIKDQTVLIVECGIAADKDIKKLYKQHGDSMIIMQHNFMDPIKDQVKEMTNLVEKKISIFCVILGDNYSYIKQDVIDLIPMTANICWYITEKNTKDTIKFLDKHTAEKLVVFNDLMQVVKIYV
jgi:hypothetical protein